jgi:dienelactone hydrolase
MCQSSVLGKVWPWLILFSIAVGSLPAQGKEAAGRVGSAQAVVIDYPGSRPARLMAAISPLAQQTQQARADAQHPPAAASGRLDAAHYPQRPVPDTILRETARREAAYLETLKSRRAAEIGALRTALAGKKWSDAAARQTIDEQAARIRRGLAQSLGLEATPQKAEVHHTTVWTWRGPAHTQMSMVDDQPVPRTVRQVEGLMEKVQIASPFGADVEALVIRSRKASKPSCAVICLPSVDAFTHLAGRKEDLAGQPQIRALVEAGLWVVTADLPALRDLSERQTMRGLVLGKPCLGRMVNELSLLVTYLEGRQDVERTRIGVYGRGLGGWVAALAAAVDARIWATIVEDGLPSYGDIIASGGELGDEWLIPRLLQYADGPSLATAIAPRPLWIAATSNTRWAAGLRAARPIGELAYTFFDTAENFAVRRLDPQEPTCRAVPEFLATALRQGGHAGESRDVGLPSPASAPVAQPMRLERINTADEWHRAREQILAGVRERLGGFPDRGNDHTAQCVERGREANFQWERLIVRTTPQTLMPILITWSEKVPPRAPAILHLSGYSISYEADALRLAGEMAANGFVGIFACPKTATGFCLGGTPHDAVGILEGRPLVGQFAWNLMGLIDYLVTRPDIDPNRLGVSGWSLGATMITYLMPFEERLRAGAGFVAFCPWEGLFDAVRTTAVTRGDGVSVLEGHTLFNVVPGILEVCDHDALLATVAPRPLLSLAGQQDEYFPYRAVQAMHDRQASVYRLLGVPRQLDLLIYPGPHDIAPPLRERAWQFFSQWLGGTAAASTGPSASAAHGDASGSYPGHDVMHHEGGR